MPEPLPTIFLIPLFCLAPSVHTADLVQHLLSHPWCTGPWKWSVPVWGKDLMGNFRSLGIHPAIRSWLLTGNQEGWGTSPGQSASGSLGTRPKGLAWPMDDLAICLRLSDMRQGRTAQPKGKKTFLSAACLPYLSFSIFYLLFLPFSVFNFRRWAEVFRKKCPCQPL